MPVLSIELFHGAESENRGAVAGTEDIGHKTHNDIRKRFGILLAWKEQRGKGQKQAGQPVDKAGFLSNFHKSAPHRHDTRKA